MIIGKPNLLINSSYLQQEVKKFKIEINTRDIWFLREKYVDRCQCDPFYILLYNHSIEDKGDDLMKEQLFTTCNSALSIKYITRLNNEQKNDYSYWKAIEKKELLKRFDRFMTMYLEDYLQPPGYYGDIYDPTCEHQRFKQKRFLYKIGSRQREIIGIGSKMFAGSPLMGAVRGKVMKKNGSPMEGITVCLISPNNNQSRKTEKNGFFWFSRVQPGQYKIHVQGQGYVTQVLEYEEFGNVKGWLMDNNSKPISDTEVRLYAPDSEIFSGWSNASGKFTTGPLPAFPYILDIPGVQFTHQVTIVSDALIGGILYNNRGQPMAGKTLVLKKDNRELAQTTTDSLGNFIFMELLGGRYQLELPGYRLFSREIVGGKIKGNIRDSSKSKTVELIAREKVVSKERTTEQYDFLFDNVVPGNYQLRIKET